MQGNQIKAANISESMSLENLWLTGDGSFISTKDPEKFRRAEIEAEVHGRLVASLYEEQLERNRRPAWTIEEAYPR